MTTTLQAELQRKRTEQWLDNLNYQLGWHSDYCNQVCADPTKLRTEVLVGVCQAIDSVGCAHIAVRYVATPKGCTDFQSWFCKLGTVCLAIPTDNPWHCLHDIHNCMHELEAGLRARNRWTRNPYWVYRNSTTLHLGTKIVFSTGDYLSYTEDSEGKLYWHHYTLPKNPTEIVDLDPFDHG